MNATTPAPTPDRLRAQIPQLVQAGRLDEAQESLETLVRQVPNDAEACVALADLLFRRGRVRDSSRPLLQAVEHLPRNAPLIVDLVQHLIARGEIVAARRCLDFLAAAPHPPAQILLAQAHLRFALGEIATAKEMLERALADGADDPDDHHMHAMLLQFSGDIDGACDVLERCLKRWPRFGDAAMVLVNLRKQTPDSNRLEFIEQQLQALPKASGDPAQAFVRAEFEYARFKVLDDLGRPDEAWPALERCNALMHELNPYDEAGEAAVAEALMGSPVVTDEDIGPRPPGPTPIFIVGMPRSGTTLLDRMLSSHSRVTTAGEIIDFWRQMHWAADIRPARNQGLLQVIERSPQIDFREVGARYLEQTQWRAQGHDYYIDKLPANIQMVGFIRRALPHAPILHMVREPMDVCFSNFKAMFGNVSSYSYDLGALAHYYTQYARLAEHWRTRLPGAMLDVSYAALVNDPQSVMHRVLDHCGLGAEDACLYPERNAAPVATPSSAQVREPIHRRGVGQWQRYKERLQVLEDRLAELPFPHS